jgi:WD40 repeat protein
VGRGLRGSHRENIAFLDVLDAESGTDVIKIPVEGPFQTVAWSSQGDRLLVGSEEPQVFTLPGGRIYRRLVDPLSTKAAFGPGGGTVLTSSSSGFATLWDLATARPLWMGGLGSGRHLEISQDGSLIANESGDDLARTFRVEMSPESRTMPVDSDDGRDNVLSLAVPVIDFSPDGRWLATAVWSAIQLRDSTGKVISVAPQGSPINHVSIRFSRDGGSVLAASGELGLVRIPLQSAGGGEPRLGEGIPVDPEPGYYIADVSKDGTRAILTNSTKGLCKIVPLDGRTPVVRWALAGAVGAAFVDGDRDVLVNSLDDDHGALLEIRDATTGGKRRNIGYRHGAHVHASADGAWVLLGAGPAKSVLVRTQDWSAGPPLPPEVQGRGNQAAFCPDGNCIAFGDGNTVYLVRTADGSVLAHLQSPQGGTYLPGLTFSPDGGQLALWWENGQLTLWDLRTLRRELALRRLDW